MPQRESRIDPREDEEGFRLLVESVIDYAIFRLDPDGYVATWNLGAERIKQYRAEEILGRHFSTFYPPEDVAAGKCEYELRTAVAQGRFEDEGWRVRKDGSRFWANVVITPLFDSKRQLRGFAKVTRDMTDRRRGEDELRQARNDAEEANRLKSEFLSRISHELRTPLTAILGFAELLQFEAPRPEQSSRLDAIARAGEHLLHLIDEVLDISRIEIGREKVSVESVGLTQVVAEAIELMEPLASARSISVDASIPADLAVRADRRRLAQVLLNLISNAIKYNREGGVVQISASTAADGAVLIDVRDSGIGIAANKTERLFQPFDRLGAERSDVGGTGLGLALSQRLVESMGGCIRVTSVAGAGSTFSVELPAADVGEDAPRTARDLPSAALPDAALATVLYIEDNEANTELVRGVLAHRPRLNLLSAVDGHSGVEMAVARLPTLILLDVHLPDIGGDVVLDMLKRDPRTGDIPVVMLTADATPQSKARFLAMGARAYVTKPMRMAQLLDVVDRLTDGSDRVDAADTGA